MPIVDQVNRDMTEAMKAREAERLSALRMVKTALQLRETEMRETGMTVDDAEAARVLNTLLKQRRDAAEQYRAAGREEQALKEENEARIIQSYLPAAAGEVEIAAAVQAAIDETGATSIKDMGAVMKAARSRLEGKTIDSKALSELVKTKLQ